MTKPPPSIAFIGFGEAASALLAGWRSREEISCTAYDIKTDAPSPAERQAKWSDYKTADIAGQPTLAEALSNRTLVFSVVTPDQALTAAQAASAHLAPGSLYLDCNSCSPGTKRRAAAVIDDAGGRYVDVAVMAPVHPARHRTPLLISGPHYEAALAALDRLDMVANVAKGPVGAASSVKMVRSIMVKGMEALVTECVLAGRLAGVDEVVLASLAETYPGIDWPNMAAYMMERVTKHGLRRAAELGEVSATLVELGLNGPMTRAAAEWQATIGALPLDPSGADYAASADAVLSELNRNNQQRVLP